MRGTGQAIYYRQEKYALAEYHFQRALSMDPGSSVLHCYLGMTYHANKRCHDAPTFETRSSSGTEQPASALPVRQCPYFYG